MKTTEFTVNSRGEGMKEALDATEKLGQNSGLGKKENLRLRLLSEELFGMVRSIVGEAEALYWAENKDKSFEIHLKSDVQMSQEKRKELLAVSTDGKNVAAKGFMGKVRDMIEAVLLPREGGPSMASLGVMSLGSPTGYRAGNISYDWSMKTYKEGISGGLAGEETDDARDELEKSIVANIADEVKVSVAGKNVEIVIYKSF